MLKFSTWSIRTQLFVLALLLTLPALGIIVYTGLKERSGDYRQAITESQLLADSLAEQQKDLTSEARLLCTLLAGLPEIKNRDAAGVQALLAEIRQQTPQYLNILVADANGKVWASAVPSASAASVSDRRYFKNAQQTKNFSSGEYVISRSANQPTLHMAYPLLEQDQFTGAIIVGFDLDIMRRTLELTRMSHEANYVFADHNGIILNRGKDDAASLIGQPLVAGALSMMENGPDRDSFEFVRRDGDTRISSYRKLWLPGEAKPYMYVRAGISKKAVMASSTQALITNVSLLLLCVLFTFLMALAIGKRSIVDRINLLKDASRHLADGSLDYTVTNQVSGGELGGFAETFDAMAQQLGAREKSLQDANRELEAFSYTLSHDLKSHLARISLASESLHELEGARLGKEGQFLVEAILSSCQGMNDLIGTMLTLAHISRQELEYQPVDLSRLAAQIGRDLAKAEPERTLHFHITPGLQVAGDPHLLQVALENLLGNACKYTRDRAEGVIRLSVRQQANERVFAVADNGTGFDMNEASGLFSPFQRLSNARGFPGFGIGLTTVQRIIHRHGGEIWAESLPGEGATFFFTLPEQSS